jgi:hypothetical protein
MMDTNWITFQCPKLSKKQVIRPCSLNKKVRNLLTGDAIDATVRTKGAQFDWWKYIPISLYLTYP